MGEKAFRIAGWTLLIVLTGFNMAKNLQSKLPSSDTLLIQDINVEAAQRFLEETRLQATGAEVKIALDVREASENSVCTPSSGLLPSFLSSSTL
jgi:hypothetical protein